MMQTLFGPENFTSESDEATRAPAEPQQLRPALLVEWSSRPRVFFSNLGDLVLRRHRRPLRLSCAPAPFWEDVLVARWRPWAALRQSTLYHIFAVVVLWGFSHSFLLPRVQPQNPFTRAKITYYAVSDYLPPLDTGSEPTEKEQKGDPEFAKQPIVSMPRQPDNSRQTIVTPSPWKLAQELKLPNIVAWAAQPLLATPEVVRESARLTLPADLAVVPPPLDLVSAATPKLASLDAAVVPPAPTSIRSTTRTPEVPSPAPVPPAPQLTPQRARALAPLPEAVVAPVISADALRRAPGAINLARLDTAVTAPRLPVVEQVAGPIRKPGDGVTRAHVSHVGGGAGQAGPATSPPLLPGGGTGSAATSLIALSIHPAPVTGPVEVPNGNLRGMFAATPEGKPGASATPEIKGGADAKSAGGPGVDGSAPASGRRSDTSLPGIHIGPGPANVPPSAAASPPNAIIAAMKPLHVEELARQSRPAPAPVRSKIEEAVFHGKRSYSLTLNMPNLTSSGGSWILRFAELHESPDRSPLSVPSPILKVDPKYPQELVRARVEGTVTLYAVILSNGTVGEVRVLHGIDERLDDSAREALSKWRFFPGTKQGVAVDVEAVVRIPFVAPRLIPE